MLLKYLVSTIGLISSVSAIFTNDTLSTHRSSRSTVTLSSKKSVLDFKGTCTYRDDSTTLLVPYTSHSTKWFKSSETSHITDMTTQIHKHHSHKTTSQEPTTTYTSTILITVTETFGRSTLTTDELTPTTIVTKESIHTSSHTTTSENFDNFDVSSSACVPVTHFVTVTAEPSTKTVTVSAKPITKYITINGYSHSLESHVKWSNSTIPF